MKKLTKFWLFMGLTNFAFMLTGSTPLWCLFGVFTNFAAAWLSESI